MKNCLLVLLFYFFANYWNNMTLADHRDPEVKTNANKQTDYFQKTIEDVKGFEIQINNGRDSTVSGLENSSKLIEEISGKSEIEVQSETKNVESIRANDLEPEGIKAVNESNIMNEIYIDENKVLYKEHRKDIESIANASKSLLDNLLMQLKDKLGVDCKQVKGNKIIEPDYRIDIKKKQDMDARYDQHFCEELHNKYYCRDELIVKCVKRGFKYSDWQYRTIRFPGSELHNSKMDWGYAVKTEWKNWDWLITPHHPKIIWVFGLDSLQLDSPWKERPDLIIADARVYIASKIGVGINQVREDIIFPLEGRGIGNQGNGPRWRKIWDLYEFGYYYRDITPTCETWSEEWNEVCKL